MLTTQILSEAEELCDDILIINQRPPGRARRSPSRSSCSSSGVYDVTVTFDQLPEDLEDELDAGSSGSGVHQRRTRWRSRCKDDEARRAGAVVARWRNAGGVLRLEVSGASLEDIFVELTPDGSGGRS